MLNWILRGRSVLLGVACMFGAGLVGAQDYPTRPVRVIVAQSPGTPPDFVARIMAAEMARILGQPFVVENKPGAGSIIGFEYVASQPADGYTIVSVNVETLAIMPLTANNLRFDPIKEFSPFIGIAEGSYFLVSSPMLPFKAFRELADYAKANPGKLNYASSSPIAHLSSEALIRELGANVTHVPYASGAPAYQSIAVGESHMGFVAEATVIALGDKLRVMAISGEKRHPSYPDVLTFNELGHPQIRGINFSFNARSATLKATTEKLHDAGSRALRQPEVIGALAKIKLEVINERPEAAGKRLADVARLYAEIARKIGLKKE